MHIASLLWSGKAFFLWLCPGIVSLSILPVAVPKDCPSLTAPFFAGALPLSTDMVTRKHNRKYNLLTPERNATEDCPPPKVSKLQTTDPDVIDIPSAASLPAVPPLPGASDDGELNDEWCEQGAEYYADSSGHDPDILSDDQQALHPEADWVDTHMLSQSLKEHRTSMIEDLRITISSTIAEANASLAAKMDSFGTTIQSVNEHVIALAQDLKTTRSEVATLAAQVSSHSQDIQELQREVHQLKHAAATGQAGFKVPDPDDVGADFTRVPCPNVVIINSTQKIEQNALHSWVISKLTAIDAQLDTLRFSSIGSSGKTFKADFGDGHLAASQARTLLSIAKDQQGKWRQLHYDDDKAPGDREIRIFLNPDRNGRQRRANRLGSALIRAWSDEHSQRVNFDRSTLILHTTGDNPVQLFKLAFTSYNDMPAIHQNGKITWPHYKAVIKAFKESISAVQHAQWQSAD